jgi:MSHA biogenesis protein MshI
MRFPFRKTQLVDSLVLSRGAAGISVASVVPHQEKPRVVVCATYAMPENTAEAWGKLAKTLHLSHKRCRVLLAPNEYQLMQVDAPNVPAAELKQAVRWKLKDMLSYPLEQATVDAIDILPDRSGTGRGHFMYAVAARNEVIKRYMDGLESAGVNLEVIDIPELAQRNIASLLEEGGRGVALLSFNGDGGLLTFTASGELYHARQIEISAAQLGLADEGQRLHNFDRLVLELQRSLDNFERQFNYVTVTRLVLGPMAGQAALEEYLRENLYIQVASLDLADVINLAAVEELENPAMQAQCFLAIGAALRAEASA